MKTSISLLSKILLFVCAVLLAIAIFLPIWRIELDAPQYPEGLVMLIYANKLGGDVEIINGLNHYIGMATLHAENFIEFTVLPYIIGAYAVLMLATALVNRKKFLYFTFITFVIFGVVAMADFWRWEYNYGHNLDPHAAIVVPNMSYQPPLIGFKQLLNFGAYSIPDSGGWLFILSGVLILFTVVMEGKFYKLFGKKQTIVSVIVLLMTSLTACSPTEPEPIVLNKDNCEYCKMTIANGRFGAELITKKGRIYKFDDLYCLAGYIEEKGIDELQLYYIHDHASSNSLINATHAFYVAHEQIKSPMGGNVAAFVKKEEAEKFAKDLGAEVVNWENVLKKFKE